VAMGGKPNSPVDGRLAAFVTAMVSETFTARGIAFDEAVEARAATGDAFSAESMVGSAINIQPVQPPAEQPSPAHTLSQAQQLAMASSVQAPFERAGAPIEREQATAPAP